MQSRGLVWRMADRDERERERERELKECIDHDDDDEILLSFNVVNAKSVKIWSKSILIKFRISRNTETLHPGWSIWNCARNSSLTMQANGIYPT